MVGQQEKDQAEEWFRDLRDKICKEFETLEIDHLQLVPTNDMAPKKFEILSLAARANASPEIPRPASSDVSSNPRASAMKIAPTKIMMKRRTLSSAEINVFSVPSRSSSVSRYFTTS